VAAQLAALAEAREITGGFLRRLERVADSLSVEEAREAFAAKGQLVLGVIRIDRALRQIVVLEQEVMGLREPIVPRGGGSGGQGSGGGRASGEAGGSLNDLNDIHDLKDLAEAEDLSDVKNLDDFYDLDALAESESYENYNQLRRRDPEAEREELRQQDIRIAEELARIAAMNLPQVSPDESRRRMVSFNAAVKEDLRKEMEILEGEWRRVREALLRHRPAPKKPGRQRGRAPP
jgi:hypothetical protein